MNYEVAKIQENEGMEKGIDPEQLPYIFEGQRSSGKNSDHHKGIGIGLSICKTIIEAHGGKLTAVNHKHGADA